VVDKTNLSLQDGQISFRVAKPSGKGLCIQERTDYAEFNTTGKNCYQHRLVDFAKKLIWIHIMILTLEPPNITLMDSH
jgi:hypothetical protein